MKVKYPTKEEISKFFEIIDGKLWRRSFINGRGHFRQPRPIIVVSLSKNGYYLVRYKDRMIMYHTIIWLLHNSDIPPDKFIDHINGDRFDNRIENLRLVTPRENGQNQIQHRNGKLVGTSLHKPSNKWRSRIEIKRKGFSLGYYDTELEAHLAYVSACKVLDSCPNLCYTLISRYCANRSVPLYIFFGVLYVTFRSMFNNSILLNFVTNGIFGIRIKI